ncbi:hypothetical protein [Streptomyces sp. NPDC053048]|uniref:hypothetical protein n=1 Tax=Streptomyces sp. NPDC053048 TaxID=3365694 RepID=UPI0037D7797C
MAEISYPFNADNANGGSAVVGQAQWQQMATMWGGDRVDFQLTGTSGQLPFDARIVNGRSVEVTPGKAWVGGFYYQLTAAMSVTIAPNPTDRARRDLIVLQADIAKSSVNLAVLPGTPSATPVAPQPRRQPGGLWEMPLYEVHAAARDASIALDSRAPFNVPTPVAYPWNVTESAKLLPSGSFIYDMDTNGDDSQYEGWVGRDGYVITRHFGKSKTYTPSLVGGTNVATRQGRWRWIAPNVVWFSAYLENTASTDAKVSNGEWAYRLTLPVPANGRTGQVFTGHIDNNSSGGAASLPNFIHVVGKTNRGSTATQMYLFSPSTSSVASGMDGLGVIPRRGYLTISGVYEAAELRE